MELLKQLGSVGLEKRGPQRASFLSKSWPRSGLYVIRARLLGSSLRAAAMGSRVEQRGWKSSSAGGHRSSGPAQEERPH